MTVTASAGIDPAWTATKPTPASQPVRDDTKPDEAAERPAEPRHAPAPEGQGTHVDIRV